MVYIKVLSKRTRKLEFAKGYAAFAGIIERHNPGELEIASEYEKLKNDLPLAEELKIENRKLPLTKQQSSLYAKMDKSVSVLNTFARNKRNRADAADEPIVPLVDFFISYLKYYTRKSAIRKLSGIGKMLEVYNGDEVRQGLAADAGLTDMMANLNSVYSELNELNERRRNEISLRRRVKTERIKHQLFYNMHDVANAIEAARINKPEIDFTDLVSELNLLVKDYNLGVKKGANRKSTDTPEVKSEAGTDEVTEVI